MWKEQQLYSARELEGAKCNRMESEREKSDAGEALMQKLIPGPIFQSAVLQIS